jgi:hypothetical protein
LRQTLPGSDALHRWLEDVVDEASGSRGLTAAWKAACSRADLGMEWCKQALADACSSLLTEARLAGAAPAGMTVEEVMQLVTAIVLATETGPSSSGSARRLLAVVVAGLKSNGAHIDTAKPPTRASSRKGQPQDPLTLTGHPSRRQRGTAGRRPK